MKMFWTELHNVMIRNRYNRNPHCVQDSKRGKEHKYMDGIKYKTATSQVDNFFQADGARLPETKLMVSWVPTEKCTIKDNTEAPHLNTVANCWGTLIDFMRTQPSPWFISIKLIALRAGIRTHQYIITEHR